MIVSHDNEPQGVSMDTLNEIFYYVNSFNDIPDRRERIIKKATYLLAGISYNQPFIDQMYVEGLRYCESMKFTHVNPDKLLSH
ncbi:MAG: hypothetical protein OER82_11405 [Nitrosopumilus sp.]|nr:hypothetical protein [Nitrosopumilus sp.]